MVFSAVIGEDEKRAKSGLKEVEEPFRGRNAVEIASKVDGYNLEIYDLQSYRSEYGKLNLSTEWPL